MRAIIDNAVELLEVQLSVSTAEDELNYFTGDPEPLPPTPDQGPLPEGIYRIVDGRLYRVVDEAAPASGRETAGV